MQSREGAERETSEQTFDGTLEMLLESDSLAQHGAMLLNAVVRSGRPWEVCCLGSSSVCTGLKNGSCGSGGLSPLLDIPTATGGSTSYVA